MRWNDVTLITASIVSLFPQHIFNNVKACNSAESRIALISHFQAAARPNVKLGVWGFVFPGNSFIRIERLKKSLFVFQNDSDSTWTLFHFNPIILPPMGNSHFISIAPACFEVYLPGSWLTELQTFKLFHFSLDEPEVFTAKTTRVQYGP